MNLRDWQHLFFDEEEKLEKLYPEWIDMTIQGDAADQFHELENSTRGLVSDAIRSFARDGDWPPMTPQQGSMVRVRLIAAYDYLDGLQLVDFDLSASRVERTKRQWIEFFLIEVWDGVAATSIHGTLESLRRAGDADSPLRYLHN